MTERNLRLLDDVEQVSLAAAEEFVRLAHKAIAERGQFVVALAGGSTPRRLYQLLAASPFRDQIDWSRVQFFFGDERSLPPDHQDSNFHMASEALLNKVPVDVSQIHRMPADLPDLDAVARNYQAEIAHVFSVPEAGPYPAFDLILLGMGPDGHTASLFPHTAALSETSRWVVANYIPKFTTNRLTLSAPLINHARYVLFLVAGADKADVLAEVLSDVHDAARLPSQMIQPQGEMHWFIDRKAAARSGRLFPVSHKNATLAKLAPSILAADFARLGEHVTEAVHAGADRIHVDVMDGHFVSNISIGPLIVKALRPVTSLPLECHLMISNPDSYLEAFAEAGADSILVHYEGAIHLHRTIQRIRALGKRAGVVINPATPASVLQEILPDIDLVLVMTVNPGFGGQSFIPSTLPKIQRVRKMIQELQPHCELEVDGGIDEKSAPLVIAAGANVLVAGSSVFGAKDGVATASARLQLPLPN